MNTQSLRALRAGLLALASVMAWGGAAAQDSPGASKGFDEYGRRNGMADHDAYQRHDDRRRYSRDGWGERDRGERRRNARERAERERRHHDRYELRDRSSGRDRPFLREPHQGG